MRGRCTQKHGVSHHTRATEDDIEAIGLSSIRFGCLFQYEIVQWFESLRGQIVLALHFSDLEINKASVGEDNEPLLPAAKEARRLLVKCTDLADASKVVTHHLVSEGCIALQNFLLQTLVSH